MTRHITTATRRSLFAAPMALASALILSSAPPAQAGQEPPAEAECRLSEPLSTTRLLRRTSLALIGRIPTMDEYGQVLGTSPSATELDTVIDAWLDSPEYLETMRRYHLELLWVNPDGAALMDGGHTLFPTTPNGDLWWLPAVQRSRAYRGGDGQHFCQNVPQTTIEPGYQLGDTPLCEPMGTDAVGAFCQEGYVEVTPYFDPAATIKVCAFEAQTIATYVQPDGVNWPNSGTVGSCDDRQSRPHGTCGCGPNLEWCLFERTYDEKNEIWADMQEQFLRLVDDYVTGERPYHEMLTTKDTYSVGRLDHYFKFQAQQPNYSQTYNRSAPDDAPLPADPDWTDRTWHKEERGGTHSGILTLPAFLLRYQTHRARANRFRIAFLGQYFVPPSGEDTQGCSNDAPDLTERCTCRGCHQTLEPLASYFGSFAEAGSAMINHYDVEVSDDEACAGQVMPGSSGLCSRFYENLGTEASPQWRLRHLEFADDHPEYFTRHDQGPAELVAEEALAPFGDKPYSHLAWATTRNLFNFLVHREIDHLAAGAAEKELLDQLATDFEMSGFDLKALAKAIVKTAAFRRMR